MIQGVIFDFNGTLFIDSDKHQLAWDKIAKEIRGYGISEEELHTMFHGVPNQYIIQYLKGEKLSDKQIAMYSSLKEQYYRELCVADQKSFHLIEGAETFLDSLTVPFTIASASIKDNMEFFRQSFHLDRWFDPSIWVYDDGTYQDKVAMFLEAARRIGVPIQNCLIFEDSISGIKNAYQAGCENIVVIDYENKGKDYFNLPGVIGVHHDFVSFAFLRVHGL